MAEISTERDSLDFRDLLYSPALVTLPKSLWPKRTAMHLRDQGTEGACAGFGLAAVIDYLNGLESRRAKPVSARMLYEMGKRHDKWPGSDYSGTSARGAMKGWHKNGVCLEAEWPYDPDRSGYLSLKRAEAALEMPLGAYYRVLPRRPDVHAALVESGAVFATARVHGGWEAPKRGRIRMEATGESEETYGHAFAILGYTPEGFLVQNSWGPKWGGLTHRKQRYQGLAIWSYEDFDAHVWDLWVARRARPVESLQALATGWMREGNSGTVPAEKAPAQFSIRDQYIHLDDGRLDGHGDFPSDPQALRESFRRVLRQQKPQHILLYAHGGLNSIKASARRVAAWKPVLEGNGIYGLHFIWETGFWAELKDVLLGREQEARERAGGFGTWWDRIIEAATGWAGRALWKEMREGAALAFAHEDSGGSSAMRWLAQEIERLPAKQRPALHLAGHSAGSIFLAHLLDRWKVDPNLPIRTLQLLAPACTLDLYHASILPAVRERRVETLHHFLLDDRRERDDTVAKIYRKSLLYLVSNAYENKHRITPLLGMARWRSQVRTTGAKDRIEHLMPTTDPDKTLATSHGSFDNDPSTMNALLAHILGKHPRVRFTQTELG